MTSIGSSSSNSISSSISPATTASDINTSIPNPSNTSTSPITNLFHSLFTLTTSILSLLAQLIQFSTITIPTIFFKILSYSFTFHLTFPSLFLLFFTLIISLLFWLRYKHLNRYERLRELPLEKDSGKDLDPDEKLNGAEEKEGFHSYLDEFLQAIRIFGYLEKPVFHELARHLQTRRLIAGDSLSLDSDFSFYIVIDGNVQVFAPLPENQKSSNDNQNQYNGAPRHGEESSDEYNGFQLINEVGSGGTLSSLFTILSLFTEGVQLSKDSTHDDQNIQSNLSSTSNLNLNQSQFGSKSNLNNLASSPFIAPSQSGSTSNFNVQSQPSTFPLNEEALKQVPNAIGSKGSVLERLNPETNHHERSSSNQTEETESNTEGSNTILDSVEHSFHRSNDLTPLEGRFNQELGLEAGLGGNGLNQNVEDDEELRMPEARASAPFPHFKPQNPTLDSSSRDPSRSPNRGRGGAGVGQFTPPTNLNRLPGGNGSINNHQNQQYQQFASNIAGLGGNQYPNSNQSQSNFPGTPLSQSQFSQFSQPTTNNNPKPTDSLHPSVTSTVARATQDTTLAVIPAEAFKRLTKKFPNAAAHIVQVILTRLSRVTLHTAHEYLGLTKEVMKSEENLNSNNRFLLEKEFYQGGGMEKLRIRFGGNLEVPVFGGGNNDSNTGKGKEKKEEEEDYFKNGRDGYLDSENVGDFSLEGIRRRKTKLERDPTITQLDSCNNNNQNSKRRTSNSNSNSTNTSTSNSPNSNFFNNKSRNPNWSNHHDGGNLNSFGDLQLKTPRARTSVGPGDLLSMTGSNNENQSGGSGSNSNSPFVTLKTPRPKSKVSNPFSFKDLDQGELIDRNKFKQRKIGERDIEEELGEVEEEGEGDKQSSSERVKSWTSLGIENFDLRDSVMNCIARSIGLLAAPTIVNSQNQLGGGNGNGSSIHASPYINPSDHSLNRGIFNSAFSSLSMLDVVGGNHNDDESSINGGTANTNNSSLNNGNFNLLEKFENEIEIKFFKKGEVLINEGSTGEGLFYVIDGFLEIGLPVKEDPLKQKTKNETSSTSNSNNNKNNRNQKADNNQRNRNWNDDEDLYSEKNSNFGNNFKQDGRGRISKGFQDDPRNRKGGISNSRGGGINNYSNRKNSSSNNNGRESPINVLPSQQFGNALDGTRPREQSKTPTNNFNTTSSSQNVNKDFSGPNPRFKKSRGDSQAPPPHPDEDQQRNQNPYDNTGANRNGNGNSSNPIYTVGRGGITGYLSTLLGKPSYVQVKAKTDCYVGLLPAHSLERMMEKRPIVLLTLCKRLLSLLSPLILHIDSALDWQQVNAGQVIYRQGDPSDSFYIVITGRLRAIAEKKNSNGGVEVLAEYGMGDSVGELDVITNELRGKTLHAIRDSELARMPMTLFNAISVRHPAITIQISRIIARRVREEMKNLSRPGISSSAPIPGLPDLGRNNLNLKTVAILPVTRDVPVSDFANRLQTALEDTIGGPTAFLNQSSVMSVLGKHAFNRMGKLKLAGWLAEQEQKFRLVLYVVDTSVSSPWSQTSVRQADSILLVGFGDDPAMGEYERLLLSIKTTARKELVLLHPERSVPPGSTREWLKTRPWIHAHHHVEMPGLTSHSSSNTSTLPSSLVDPKAVKALRNLKQKLETSFQRYKGKHATVVPSRPSHFSDFARLARRLRGKSIGLVLGGGGARGCAHIGVLRALEERGIAVDMVGGTSIGSLIGGLYAKEAELVSTLGRAKKFSGRMASLWRFASDLTYPVVSYTTGHEFNRGIFKAFSDTHIEDMWLPFFANSVNITWSRMEVHTTGYAWRYIRASMTLAGLIPPLVDDGCMLVDGGYVDNLPVSVMLAMGARDVFAVDVGSIDDTSPRSYGDTLSGWWVLINKWNPWSDARNIPSIPDIQGRLTYVSSVKTLEEAKKTPGCFYMRMPVEGYGTLEFGKFTEIAQIGYDASSRMLDDWAAEGRLPTGTDELDLDGEMAKRRRKAGISARRNSV